MPEQILIFCDKCQGFYKSKNPEKWTCFVNCDEHVDLEVVL